MSPRNYWIGVVSKNHAAIGVAGGFTQINHGKAGPLERMRPATASSYYSPRADIPGARRAGIHRHRPRARRCDLPGRKRRHPPVPARVDYLPAQAAPIKPMLEELSFIRSKEHWGAAFRFGFLRVPEEDFARIAAAMGARLRARFRSRRARLDVALCAALSSCLRRSERRRRWA